MLEREFCKENVVQGEENTANIYVFWDELKKRGIQFLEHRGIQADIRKNLLEILYQEKKLVCHRTYRDVMKAHEMICAIQIWSLVGVRMKMILKWEWFLHYRLPELK